MLMRQVNDKEDLGMLEFIIVMVIAVSCIYMENADKRAGRYPRDWK